VKRSGLQSEFENQNQKKETCITLIGLSSMCIGGGSVVDDFWGKKKDVSLRCLSPSARGLMLYRWELPCIGVFNLRVRLDRLRTHMARVIIAGSAKDYR